MPRRQEPMKDGVSTDMPRGAASERRSVDFRMGQPAIRNGIVSIPEYIGYGGQPRELKHLSTSRKRNQQRFPQ